MFQFNPSQIPNTTAAAALSFGTPGITVAAQAQPPPAATTSSSGLGGLGGSTSTSNFSNQNRENVDEKIMTPMLTPLPAEILQLVENFKNFLKTQLNFSESILAEYYDVENGPNFQESLRKLNANLIEQKSKLEIYGQKSQDLKAESRRDLRSAEMALHLVESPNSGYTHYGYMVLINYLTNAALVSEEKLANLTRQIQIYENMLISRKYGPNSSSTGANIRDILLNIKFLDAEIKRSSTDVFRLRSNLDDMKELFLNYRRRYFNDNFAYFEEKIVLAPPLQTSGAGPNLLRDCPSTAGALLEMAKALSRTSTDRSFGVLPAGLQNTSSFLATKPSASTPTKNNQWNLNATPINQWNLGATPSNQWNMGATPNNQLNLGATPSNQWNLGAAPTSSFSIGRKDQRTTVGVARPSFIASTTDQQQQQQSSKRNKTGFFKET